MSVVMCNAVCQVLCVACLGVCVSVECVLLVHVVFVVCLVVVAFVLRVIVAMCVFVFGLTFLLPVMHLFTARTLPQNIYAELIPAKKKL